MPMRARVVAMRVVGYQGVAEEGGEGDGVAAPFAAVQVAHLCYRETLTRQEFAKAFAQGPPRRQCGAWTVYRKVGLRPPINGDTFTSASLSLSSNGQGY